MKNLNEKKWNEENGVIYFSVTSDGRTGEEWLKYFEKKNYLSNFNPRSTHTLFFSKIKPTKGTTYKLAVLRGKLFSDHGRTTYNIEVKANNMKLITPSLEIAFLVRDKFTNDELKAMGCLGSLVIMHKPIEVYDYGSLVAEVLTHHEEIIFSGSRGNVSFCGRESSYAWDEYHDFLFVASEDLSKEG